MQTILEKNGRIHLIFNYKPHLVDAVRNIPGRRWDAVSRSWTVPISSKMEVDRFASKFGFTYSDPNKRIEQEDFLIPEMPELKVDIKLKMNLFDFQKTGVAYCLAKKRLIVGDQPGLGKTCQAIATMVAANTFPCLVICPSSLKLNWQREIHMWTDKKAMLLSDKNKDTWPMFAQTGANLFEGAVMNHVFIVNYESLKKYFVASISEHDGPLRLNHIKFKQVISLFKMVILDESHRCKEIKTQQTKFVKGICHGKEWILALTGTPVVNKPKDLISQLGIIDQLNEFGGYTNFTKRYCDDTYGNGSNLKELNYRLATTCFYRRDKSEVLKDLPAKMRQVVLCDISTKKEYKDALADLEEYLKKYKHATDDQVARSMKGEVMVKIGVLKNISARGKINDVVEYVNDVIDSGEKIVLFTHLHDVQNNLKRHFPDALTILGDDDGATRQRNVDLFQGKREIGRRTSGPFSEPIYEQIPYEQQQKLIICSIKAAGVGITLTASSRVAFVELPWHPADSEQCEDRCHRIGQIDSVQCTYFLGKNTIDEWIFKIIDEKRAVSNTITGAKDDVEQSVIDGIINLFAMRL